MVESVLRLTGRRLTVALTAVVALLHGVSMLHAGVRLSSDSQTYARWADLLVSQHFNVAVFLRQTSFVVPPVLYIGWVLVMATAKGLFGSSWAAGVVALNWISLVAIVYLTLSAIQSVTRSAASLFLGAMLFAIAGDFLLFESFVLSDLFFVALSTCVIAAAVRATPSALAVGSGFVVAACFVRPTAAPLVVFWLLVLVVRDKPLTAGQVRAGAVAVALLVAAAVVADALIMMRPGIWPFAAVSGWIHQLSGEYHRGVVVFDRPDTFAAPPVAYRSFVALTLWKWLFYFAPWARDYSAAHKVLSLLFLAPLYLFAAVAFATWRDRRLKALLVFYVLAFSVFHAVQQIDFDYRYRMPVLPALIVMAGVGWSAASAWARRAPDRVR